MSVAQQVSILFAANEGFLDNVDNKEITSYKKGWFEHLEANLAELVQKLNAGSNLDDADAELLRKELTKYNESL